MIELSEIKRVLITEWDPLDISENQNLHDEYDAIVNVIYKMDHDLDFYNRVWQFLYNSEKNFEIDPIDESRLERVANLLAKLVS